jgi:hypothetical protein
MILALAELAVTILASSEGIHVTIAQPPHEADQRCLSGTTGGQI